MRFAATVAAISLLALGSTACGSSSSSSSSPTSSATTTKASSTLFKELPTSIQSSGTIIDYVEPTFPPMEMAETNSTALTGVDVEMAKAVAAVIGVKLKIVSVEDFAELFPALSTSRADMVWSGVFDTPSRTANTFADYFRTGTQLYIPKSEAKTYSSVSDLCGQTIAGETATFYQANLTAAFKGICQGKKGLSFVNESGIASQNEQIQEGRAVAAVAGPESVDYLEETQPGKWQAIGPTYYPTYYGVVFENTTFGKTLEHVIEQGIDQVIANGSYLKILKQFGLQAQAIKTSSINKGSNQP